jgi:hypothetical protein
VNGVVVPGLTGTLGLTYTGVSAGGTTWNFNYVVDNTSSGGITSELSAFALNTTPNPVGGSATGLFSGDVSVNSQLSSGTIVDFCASAGNNSCSGGSSNGIDPTDAPAMGTFSLIFATALSSISLDQAFVRYQGITGNGFNGASGIGTNSNVVINPVVINPVPLPAVGAAIPLILGFGGYAAWRKRRKQAAA